MIEYKCDRCGKPISADWRRVFTVEFKPPEIWKYTGKLMEYPDGEYHFCEECILFINASMSLGGVGDD